MNISEKIQQNTPNEIKIYLEGVFWIAYEQSAYYFWKLKGYKPTKKFVKIEGAEVVSVGFPNNVLENPELAHKIEDIEEQKKNKIILFQIEEPISETDFLKWKEELPLSLPSLPPLVKTNGNGGNDISIIEELKNFDMLTKTPMECMIFLSEIKKKLSNNRTIE